MSNILEYKGYHSKIEFDINDKVLRGKIEGINDLILFESGDIENIEFEFHNAVDDYLEFCKEVGKEPDKEYKGSFNIRINPLLHKKISLIALRNGESLNSTVERAIADFVSEEHQLNKKIHQDLEQLTKVINTEVKYVNSGQVKNVDINISRDFNMIYREGMKH